jgi:hypothetical protein
LQSICIPSSVQVLCCRCFAQCRALSSVTFEQNSRLTRIENRTFCDCKALKSICIPESIQRIERYWYNSSSLTRVTFESGASLVRMIDSG